ncbi:hypothetical protein A9Q84_02255 [Halobacteriovorax marinus]|uniref:Uncharacterized protein n=1 Tax=Halobacteriovorax marinus TaxID=97084 RepID=A0A1Y5FCE3_9BACT|nr:hypothetical protein A9Q84_02255 [Halobacteriovorax marinus]
MRNLKFIAVVLLSIVSLSPKFGIQNSRDISSVDCIDCVSNSEVSTHSNQVEKAVEKITKSIPKLTGNAGTFAKLKTGQKCEAFYSDKHKSTGRLTKDIQYHLPINDEMFEDDSEAQNAFYMESVVKGRMKSKREVKPYIGKSMEGDIFMIEKAYRGASLVGYNITVSFCSLEKKSGKKLIHDSRKLVNMGVLSVTFGEASSCGDFYDIDNAEMGMVSKGKGLFNSDVPFQKMISSIDCE